MEELQHIFHMNGGEGESSYAKNSSLQKTMILKAKPIVEKSIKEMYNNGFPKCIRIADMGCSSGPNALLPIIGMIESINTNCNEFNQKPPMLQVFLNDLPSNDFNTIFKSLPSFYDHVEQQNYMKGNAIITDKTANSVPCFVAGVPGSFYGRLFPDESLNFVHSSNGVHWLSQVPKGLVNESKVALNKGSICITQTSPPGVRKAYLDQFQKDFTLFLKLRSEEMINGGRMVLSVVGDHACDNYFPNIMEVLDVTLNQMVAEGLIEDDTLDSFHIPIYYPSLEEARLVIEKEGSFKIHLLETYQIKWDGDLDFVVKKDLVAADFTMIAQRVAKILKAVGEPHFVSHFGEAITFSLFDRLPLTVLEYIKKGKDELTNLIISLEKY